MPRYLPRGTNMKVFDRQCRAAMSAACGAVADANVIGDPSPELRALAAQVLQASLPIPQKIVAMLRKQLGVETDDKAKAAIIRALVAAGELSKAELAALRKKSAPSVVFATAWKAVQSGAEIEPWHFETLAKHWDACAEKLESEGVCNDAIVELVAARKLKRELLPLLNALATQPTAAAQRAAIDGAAALAGMSRAAREDAIEALFHVAQNPALAATERRRLTHTLCETGRGGRVADVICTLATTDPSPTWTQNVKHGVNGKIVDEPHARDIRADAALALLHAGDARWEQLLSQAHPGTDMAGIRTCGALPFALKQAKAPCTPALLAMACERMTAGSDSSAWCELLAEWPTGKVTQYDDVIAAALPRAVRCVSQLLGLWWETSAVPRLAAFAKELDARCSNEAMWPHIALAEITGDVRHFEQARAAYERDDKEGKARYFLADLLNAWADHPRRGEAFYALCRTLITGKPAVSYHEREEQLLAIRALAPAGVDGLESVWPTLLAIIDKAQQPLANAAALAVELAGDGQISKLQKESLVKILESIVTNGRADWFGKDERAPVAAMNALLRLQPEREHPKALAAYLGALKKSARDHRLLPLVPEICRALENLAQQNPLHRKKIASAVNRLLASDTCVVVVSDEDSVRLDDAFCQTLNETKARLGFAA